jgi:uncharacterized membrane protein
MGRGAKKKEKTDREPVQRDWAVAALAALGFLLAGYLTLTKLGAESPLFCEAGSGCDIVQGSRYGVFFGLPTALWGALVYAGIGGLALAGLDTGRWLAAFLLSVLGVSFSAYLTYLELFEIRAICGYCVVSAVIIVVLFAVLLFRRRSVPGQRSAVRPSRIAPLGTVVAVATVLVGAGYYAAGPEGSAAYQEALARHLAGSGAVMYGAYW